MAHARVAKDSAHRERNSNPKVPKCPFLDKFSTNFPLEKIVQGVVVQLVMGLWCLNRKQDIHCYVNYFGLDTYLKLCAEISNTLSEIHLSVALEIDIFWFAL